MGYLVLKGKWKCMNILGGKSREDCLGHIRVDERIILKLLKNEDVNA
jgi:hypothetical protein